MYYKALRVPLIKMCFLEVYASPHKLRHGYIICFIEPPAGASQSPAPSPAHMSLASSNKMNVFTHPDSDDPIAQTIYRMIEPEDKVLQISKYIEANTLLDYTLSSLSLSLSTPTIRCPFNISVLH